jgi:parallel beta-helix repeat protein
VLSRRTRRFAVLATACLAAAAGTPPAHAATVVVPPGQSIQSAVDAASPGDTIRVLGHHEENVAITTDGLNLIGDGATLTPPAEPQENACSGDGDVIGFCVLGNVDFSTGRIIRNVHRVHISGFTISGFGDGIFAFGSERARFIKNTVDDSSSYGIAAFSSTRTNVERNHVSGGDEAGLYIGDSEHALAVLRDNRVSDSTFGILLRNSEHGTVVGNEVHGNCLGLIVLADAPGPSGNWEIVHNRFNHNSRACPASEDGPPVSGIGVAIVGGNDNLLRDNQANDNVPSGPTAFTAGIIVHQGFGGTAEQGNTVTENVALGNAVDLIWDQVGAGNVFTGNTCATSVPGGLCS